uniref:Uncharacterized protein n=1 Tax=Caldiarchaeum subterraneum TaxID=311458 RepID=E6NAV5_CALS0|nr:hypothetical protein HGMM_F15C04C10 [Candidatus Caldarchaeum subterraneum]
MRSLVLFFIIFSLIFPSIMASYALQVEPQEDQKREPPNYKLIIERDVSEQQFQQGCLVSTYVGGYEDNAYNGRKADAVRATFSFPDTTPSVIPEGRYLKGWIESTVFTSINSLDYGYRVGIELNRREMIVWAEVWKFCEGLPGSGCGATSAQLMLGSGLVISAVPSDKIELKMQWDNTYMVGFYYRVNNGPYVRFAEFSRPPEAQSKFSLGTNWIWFFGLTVELQNTFSFRSKAPVTSAWVGGACW